MNRHSTILAVLMLAAVAVTYFGSIRLTAAPAQSA
jgi:hypothetical protein